MVEAYPADGALLDGVVEGGDGCGLPGVGWVVELEEELVMREECGVDFVGVFDVVDGEVVALGFFSEPDLGGVDEGLVDSAGFGDGEDVEGLWGLGEKGGKDGKGDEKQCCEAAKCSARAERHACSLEAWVKMQFAQNKASAILSKQYIGSVV